MTDALRSWRWRIFAATWAAYAGYYFCRKPFFVAKSALEDAYHWRPEQLATIGTAYLVMYAIGQFVAGYSGTRWGPRNALLAGMAISIACNVAFGLTSSLWVFGLFMAVNGLVQATGWSNVVGTMGQWYARRERGTVMGIWSTNFQFGGIASNALAAAMLGAYGLRGTFWSGALVFAGVWILVFAWQRNRPEDVGLPPVVDDPDAAPGAAEEGWTREIATNVAIVGVFYFFVKFIRYALWSWAPYLLHTAFGLEGAQAGYLSTVFDVAGIFGVVSLGFVSDRYFAGKRTVVAFVSILLMAVACGLLYAFGGAACSCSRCASGSSASRCSGRTR